MYHPPAFDYDSRIAIESRIPPHKRIIVDTFDAGNFACNAINIDDRVFLHRASDPLKARLMLAGFKVHEVELTEFLKAGGSAKCLSLKLTEPVAIGMGAALRYSIRPKDPAAHLYEVSLTVEKPDPHGQVFAMPAWIPGSYMIRDYAKHVVAIRAESDGCASSWKSSTRAAGRRRRQSDH